MSRKWMLRIAAAALVTTGLVGTATVAGAAANSDHVWAGEKLVAGAYQTSNNGEYRLIQQADGNLVEYKRKNGKYSEALWSTGTARNPGAATFVQKDGNLVVRKKDDPKSTAIWSSNTATPKVSHLTVQNDGNVVLYDRSGTALWASRGLTLPGGPGPQNFRQADAASAAEREVGSVRSAAGYGDEGQCIVSAMRWIRAAGGKTAGGGVLDTYRPAKLIATGNSGVVGNAARGDVIQYVHNTYKNDFRDGVHTVMVAGKNSDGSLRIVQSNGDPYRNPGKVTSSSSWTPRPPAGFTAYLYRFGR